MTTTHTIGAIESGSHPVFGDWEIARTITFTYTPGSRPTTVDPGAGPTIELAKVEPGPDAPAAFLDLAEKHLRTWAEDWLEDHHDEVVASAQEDLAGEADAWADFKRRERIDERLMEGR